MNVSFPVLLIVTAYTGVYWTTFSYHLVNLFAQVL